MLDRFDGVLDWLVSPIFKIGSNQFSALSVLSVLLSLILVVLIAKFLRRLIMGKVLSKTKIDSGLQHAISTFAYYGALVAGVMVVLSSAGLDLTSIAIFGGALGLGIGLGMQQTALNFVSGIILLVARPITPGDRIKVDDFEATVDNIGVYSTTLLMMDKAEIIVPNSYLLDKPVTNWTLTDEIRAVRIPIGLHYKTNPKVAKAVIEEAVSKSENILKDPAPDLQLMGFGDSSIDFSLLVWTTTMVYRVPALTSEINYIMHEALEANGLVIPYPQRDLHIVSSDVKLN